MFQLLKIQDVVGNKKLGYDKYVFVYVYVKRKEEATDIISDINSVLQRDIAN